MSKAKQIGTSAETGVRNHLLREGYSELDARRNVLTGSLDQGDVWLHDEKHGLIVFEVKGGASAKTASHEQTIKWLEEARVECLNASGSYGFLVTQRAGFSAARSGDWWAYTDVDSLVRLIGATDPNIRPNSAPIRLTLKHLTDLIRG